MFEGLLDSWAPKLLNQGSYSSFDLYLKIKTPTRWLGLGLTKRESDFRFAGFRTLSGQLFPFYEGAYLSKNRKFHFKHLDSMFLDDQKKEWAFIRHS